MCADCEPTPNDATPNKHEDVEGLSRRLVLGGLGGGALVAGGAVMGFVPEAAAETQRRQRPAKLELVLLGTKAGPPVDPTRTGIASALVVDGSIYVIDCGRAAVTQYRRAGLQLGSLRAIFLTHLHADHIADYYNFFLLGGYVPLPGDRMLDHIDVYGPGSAGGLPPAFGGKQVPTVNPANPTPGIIELTDSCHAAYAYSSNIFMRDSGIRDIRSLADIHEVALPDVEATFENTAPTMAPFVVMQDEKVRVTATLVPHGPCFPAFAYRFDTEHGSVTFSGDTTYTPNIPRLARGTDVLVHEAINLEGASGSPAFINHLIQSHVEVQKVGAIAREAGAHKLVLSHVADVAAVPLNTHKWQRWAQRGYHGTVVIGKDLQRIRIR